MRLQSCRQLLALPNIWAVFEQEFINSIRKDRPDDEGKSKEQ